MTGLATLRRTLAAKTPRQRRGSTGGFTPATPATHWLMFDASASDSDVAEWQAMTTGNLPAIAGIWGADGVISSEDAQSATHASVLHVYSVAGEVSAEDFLLGKGVGGVRQGGMLGLPKDCSSCRSRHRRLQGKACCREHLRGVFLVGVLRTMQRYLALDGMRGIAALCVMLVHYKATLPWGLPALPNAGLAVDFFFVLSGFVVSHAYADQLLDGRLAAIEYAKRRVIRLGPMFLLGIAIGAPVLLTMTFSGASTYPAWLVGLSATLNLALLPFFSDFVALAPDGGFPVGEVFPSNPPSWSLFFELVASLCFLGLIRLRSWHLILVAGVSFALLAAFAFGIRAPGERWDIQLGWSTENFVGGFFRVISSFVLGMLLSRLLKGRGQRLRRVWIVYAALVAIFAVPVMPARGLYEAVVMLIAAPALVYWGAQVNVRQGERKVTTASVSKWLGDLSYPLYCLHYPIGRLVFMQDSLPRWVLLVEAILASICVSLLVAKLVDEPAREWLQAKLRRRQPIH